MESITMHRNNVRRSGEENPYEDITGYQNPLAAEFEATVRLL